MLCYCKFNNHHGTESLLVVCVLIIGDFLESLEVREGNAHFSPKKHWIKLLKTAPEVMGER